MDGAHTLALKAKVLLGEMHPVARSVPYSVLKMTNLAMSSDSAYRSPQLSLLRKASKKPLSLRRTRLTV